MKSSVYECNQYAKVSNGALEVDARPAGEVVLI